MTDTRLDYDEIEKLLKEATPGPWYVLEVGNTTFVAAKPTPDHPYYGRTRHMDVDGDENYPRKQADQKLKALAPTLARELLDRQRWVPVSPETMPEPMQSVLLAIPTWRLAAAKDFEWHTEVGWREVRGDGEDDVFGTESETYELDEVEFWQPIQLPVKTERSCESDR